MYLSDDQLPPGVLQLDPFGFHVDTASRLPGQGGTRHIPDPSYAFHTPYVEAGTGECHFVVRLHGLRARRGTLYLRVNMLPNEPGAHARTVNTDRILFNRLVDQDGVVSIRFEGFRGVRFALHGLIPDESDVTVDGITVYLDRPAGEDDEHPALEARGTAFRSEQVRPAAALRSIGRPTLAAPVSQVATAGQLGEAVFAAWRKDLDLPVRNPMAWDGAYALETLRCYGMLAPGAHALAIGSEASPVPALLAARGIEVDAVTAHAPPASVPGLRYREAGLDALPREFVNFDLAWSDTLLDLPEPVGTRLALAETVLARLRPGGLLVLTFAFQIDSLVELGTGRSDPLNRHDIARLAVLLISRNHEVAQLKFDPADAIDYSPDGRRIGRYGFTARRAPSGF